MRNTDIYSEKNYATIMRKENSIDIDDQLDFTIAETMLNFKNKIY